MGWTRLDEASVQLQAGKAPARRLRHGSCGDLASFRLSSPSAHCTPRRSPDLAACILAVGRTRDRDAFIVLFSYFAPRLKTYLRRRGSSVSVAEDLAQETLLTVWKKAGSFDPAKAGASTWVFTIARNLQIDTQRHERHQADVDGQLEVGAAEASAGEDHVARSERERRVRKAMGELPAKQAEVIRLAFFEDSSHTEIERRLGTPLGTVKSRIRLALQYLRLAFDRNP